MNVPMALRVLADSLEENGFLLADVALDDRRALVLRVSAEGEASLGVLGLNDPVCVTASVAGRQQPGPFVPRDEFGAGGS